MTGGQAGGRAREEEIWAPGQLDQACQARAEARLEPRPRPQDTGQRPPRRPQPGAAAPVPAWRQWRLPPAPMAAARASPTRGFQTQPSKRALARALSARRCLGRLATAAVCLIACNAAPLGRDHCEVAVPSAEGPFHAATRRGLGTGGCSFATRDAPAGPGGVAQRAPTDPSGRACARPGAPPPTPRS